MDEEAARAAILSAIGRLDKACARNCEAELKIVRDYWWVEDCESTNGIEVNGGVVFTEKLKPGFGGREHAFGLEVTMGKVLGDAVDNPILFVKSCTGGTTLPDNKQHPEVWEAMS